MELLKVIFMTKNFQPATHYWFIFQEELMLVSTTHPNYQPLDESLMSQLKFSFSSIYEFDLDSNTHCFCTEIEKSVQLPDHVNLVPIRKAFELLGDEWYGAAAKARSIITWNKTHQFCGRCGHPTIKNINKLERQCVNCGLLIYPRISPSIIVLIQHNDYVLMARGPHFAPNAYALIAGFVDVGETIEETVHREVFEEVHLKIKNLQYFGSQAWPFPDSLMIAFIADYESGDIIIDKDELEAADWYHYNNLPGYPSRISIAHKLIDYFVASRQTLK